MRLATAFAAIAAAATLSLGATAAFADGEGPCKIATKGDSLTAKAKGVKFVCDDCHKNMDDYALTDNAKKDFEKLLAAQ